MPQHCYRHDIDYAHQSQCPECRADEASEHRRRTIEQQEEAREEKRQSEEKVIPSNSVPTSTEEGSMCWKSTPDQRAT